MPDSPVLAVPSRRSFLRGAAGVAAVTAAGLLIAEAKPARAVDYTLQVNWGWCSLCSQLYDAGPSFKGQGDCPAQPGDGHATPGWNYSMIYNQATTPGLPGTPGYQSGWRWCQYCQSPYQPWTNGTGQCVAEKGSNGAHSPGPSYNYAMAVGLSGSSYQGGWSPCIKCSVLYHSNNGSGTDAGFCWVNSQTIGSGKTTHSHDGSWPYKMIH